MRLQEATTDPLLPIIPGWQLTCTFTATVCAPVLPWARWKGKETKRQGETDQKGKGVEKSIAKVRKEVKLKEDGLKGSLLKKVKRNEYLKRMSSYREAISKARGNMGTNWVKRIKVQKEKPWGDIERSSVIWNSFYSPVWTWIYCGCYQVPLRVKLKSSYTVLPKKLPSSWPPSLLVQGEKSELM